MTRPPERLLILSLQAVDMSTNTINIILAGNPNSGKTSLFNALTGLNQKVGNYAGVTVDKIYGHTDIEGLSAMVTDLPGIYGMYPKSEDEIVAHEVLVQHNNTAEAAIVVVIADASNLKRNLLLCSQIMDLDLPVVLALSMADIAAQKGILINTQQLSLELGVPVVTVNPRKNTGITELKAAIRELHRSRQAHPAFITHPELSQHLDTIAGKLRLRNRYAALLSLNNIHISGYLTEPQQEWLGQYIRDHSLSITAIQGQDILQRYRKIDSILALAVTREAGSGKKSASQSIDRWLLHPVWGYLIMLAVLFVVFQAIFWLAAFPMDWIESGFAVLTDWAGSILPEGQWYSSLITDGILAGLGGIVVFVPQIAILFFFISILEDTGYMARISFLTDRIMNKSGMNGRSVMPLISGMACAIPAIMAARTIRDPKERLITIMVTPLMSCSARLPVYTLLISMFIPDRPIARIFNMQGLVLMLMYLLGILASLAVAFVLKHIIRKKDKDFFLMELPLYRMPRWENAFITMIEKARIFVTDAGKIILLLSIVLWFTASYGPGEQMQAVEDKYAQLEQQQELTEQQQEDKSNEKLAASYAGILGRSIEPLIAPLGYDWKIGIALISSFAAREVFVGTMATLYAVGSVDDDDTPLKEKMLAARKPDGTPVYTMATGMSLMIFYAFAMQCISTIAIVKRETKSWKWTIFQVLYMTGLAYLMAYLTYRIFL